MLKNLLSTRPAYRPQMVSLRWALLHRSIELRNTARPGAFDAAKVARKHWKSWVQLHPGLLSAILAAVVGEITSLQAGKVRTVWEYENVLEHFVEASSSLILTSSWVTSRLWLKKCPQCNIALQYVIGQCSKPLRWHTHDTPKLFLKHVQGTAQCHHTVWRSRNFEIHSYSSQGSLGGILRSWWSSFQNLTTFVAKSCILVPAEQFRV